MNGKEVGKKYAHGSPPTSKTLGKLADTLTMLREVVHAPFFMRLFEIEGQWNIIEVENGYKFIRIDSPPPNGVETSKSSQ
ncbi:MAG: hypothetical protein E6Q24_19500 [Chitinophagaceae bacterium]|nr:MAG: hypothetical protein E6Q24_19500 [Chitinophagaceae bacterium]